MAAIAQPLPRYKRITAGFILALFWLWMAYLLLWPNQGSRTAGTGVLAGSAAPDFALTTVAGQSYRLSELKGRPVVLNFWATWCAPCRAEMPVLEAAYQENQSQGLVILAVNLDESDVAIRAFQEKLGLTFPIVVDEGQRVTRMYGITPLPTSYFIDRDGIVRGRWQGEIQADQLDALLRKIL